MTLTNLILLGLIIIDTGLYILSLLKKIGLLRKISSSIFLPFAGAFLTLFLFSYLPDSRHIIIVTISALSMASLAVIFFCFTTTTRSNVFFKLSYILSLIIWIELYRSCFYIYRIPVLLYTLCSITYFSILIAIFIFSGKQRIYYYINHILGLLAGFLLNFCSFIILCYTPCLQSVLLFTGTLSALALIVFYILHITKYNFRYYRQLFFIILISSQILITVSNIMLIK